MTDAWTLADFDSLLEHGHAVCDDDNGLLRNLGRRIAGQAVDVIGAFTQEVFAGPPGPAAADALHEATSALTRLVVATKDVALEAHLRELSLLVARASDTHPSRRSAFLRDMRGWVLQMADLLTEEDGLHLRTLVDADTADAPLLGHLRGVPGVGPRRIQRLYCAGLYTPETLAAADPEDVSILTGIPVSVARRCVAESAAFSAAQFDRHVNQLRRECHMVLELARRRSELEPDVVDLLAVAVSRLRGVLEHLESPPEKSWAVLTTSLGTEVSDQQHRRHHGGGLDRHRRSDDRQRDAAGAGRRLRGGHERRAAGDRRANQRGARAG